MKVKKVRQGWKVSRQILMWMLVISLVVSAVPLLPAQSAVAAELPMQMTKVTTSTGFQDVSPTDWFYDAVVHVQEKGIFSGTNASSFSPKGTMTRAMYVTALGRMAGVDAGAYSTSSFADVQAGSWYAPYVEWAVKKGITDGTGDRKYSPDATVSREQMATMTLRYFESEQIPYQTENPVTTEPGDLGDVSPWAADAVIKLWQAGVFTGDEKGNFNPRAQATRAEAAVLFMRNNAVVEAWKNQNQTPVTPTPTPTPTPTSPVTPTTGGNSGGGTPGDNGGNPGTGSTAYTLTFESNGGTAVAAQTVRKGQVLNNLPAPTKEGYIFQGWFADSDLSLIFASGSTLNADTKLYAKYTDSIDRAVQSVPSYSVLDVAPNFTIKVQDSSGSLTESQVKEGMNFVDTANPEFEGVTVSGGNGVFTVSSAAENGKFVEGNTYQLTLTDDSLSFQGQDATTSIYVFSVAKQEVMNVPLNPNMIYIPFTDVTDMVINGADVDSPAISVVTTTVGGENALAEVNASSGTFKYTGSTGTVIQVGDTVAIYEGVSPKLRTVETTGEDDGDVAYVQITAVDGSVYTYDHADANQVLFKPDVLPVSIEADKDGIPNNHSITVEHTAMNYSDSLYKPFGLDELTTVDVGDFIGFYDGQFDQEGIEIMGYGRITSITPEAEMDVITYEDATIEDIENAFNIYQKQAIDGDDLFSEEQIAQLEEQIEQQARDSGFVNEAADYLSDIAMETKEIQEIKAQSSLASSKGSRVSVENLTVFASLGTRLKNIDGRTSGVSVTLQVGADIVVNINEDSDLVIHMTGTFVQEMSLDLGINGDMKGHWLKKWGIPYWYSIDDYVITANLDAYSYTGMNITAEIALVEHDKLNDALNDWVGEKNAGRLGKVQNIATQIKAVMAGVQDTAVDAESLKEKYQEMLEQDTEWFPLIKKELFEKSVRVALGIVEVKFEAEFVVSAQVNLTVGADFYYKMAKRYSVSLRVLSFSGSSNTVSLPGDGDYQFTFYVMGTIGLRAGIHMEVKAGIGSVKLNSIGLAVEPGVYVNLWGYFYYQLKNISGVKTTKSLGALFVEIGIYLEVELGAQLGDGALSGGVELVDEEWPLYTIGEEQNVYDFAYPQDKSLKVNMAGSASSIAVPELWVTMNTFDLKTGDTDEQAYDRSNFDIQVDNPNFKYDAANGMIEVVDKNIQVSDGNLVITWKGAPASFMSEPLKRTIQLSWLARVGDYILQLDPQNSGVTQVVAAPYNAPISVVTPVYPGYTFDGWYTAASGGTKITIPNRMAAEDRKLYAHWIANKNTPYTVEYYVLDPNSRIQAPPVDTENRTGTTDTEIRISSDRFKEQGYATGTVSGVLIKGDGSTVVRVNYYPENRKMTFVGGYAGAPQISLTEAVGKNIAARIPVPTRQGYTFAGWSPEAPSTMPIEDTTYTAKWTGREGTPYQVVYLLQNIGSDTYTVADTESYRGVTGTEANLADVKPRSYDGFVRDDSISVLTDLITSNGKTALKVYYKRDVYQMTVDYNGSGATNKTDNVPFGATMLLRLGTPTWQGYSFTGWSPTPPTTMPAEDVQFTAQWAINDYTVNFDSNGGSEEVPAQTVGFGATISTPTEPTKDGYVFGGWYSDNTLTNAYDFATAVTADLTLYAKWLIPYTISFESNEGSVVDAQTVNEGVKAMAPAPPTKDGYVFSGWYSDSELMNAYNFTTMVVTGDLTLYAKWTVYVPITYTVTFESNGGSLVTEQTVNEGAVATAPGAPMLEGYTFDGWYSDSELMIPYGFTEGVIANVMLYGKWTKNSYTVSFNSNNGSSVSSQSVSEGDTAVVPDAPTRAGHVFEGWYSDAGLNESYSFMTPVMNNLTLYAKWTAIYTVTFNSNGGSLVAEQNMQTGGNATEPAVPTRDGYVFNGWYSDAGLNEAYSFTTSVTGNLTLYAKWTFNSRTVDFDSNGGAAVGSQTVVTGDKAVAPAALKWAGYRFEGWYSDRDLKIAYDFMTPVTSNITLYAKWTMTSWLQVGDLLDLNSKSNVIFDSQGTPYVAYIKDNYEVFVMQFKGGKWQSFGNQSDLEKAGGLGSSAISLGIDSKDKLYVAYKNSSGKVSFKNYNDEHKWWRPVSTISDFSWNDGKTSRKVDKVNDSFFITFDKDDNPFLMFRGILVGNAAEPSMLMSWSYHEGSGWKQEARLEAFAGLRAFLAPLPNNGMYLFAPFRLTGTPVAKGYSLADGLWKQLDGKAYLITANMDAASALDPSGVPYMIYLSSSNGVEMWKYPHSTPSEDTTWEKVNTSGFSVGTSQEGSMDMAFDSEGTPYVAYRDAADGNRVTVLKYENMDWRPVGSAGFSAGDVLQLDITIDSTDNIYVSYKEQGKMNVMKFDPNFK
ncbi:InlB B-repeat-containing protein [Paenibacillus sp. FSL H7-689]|uniref:InlB B-repeat-containing protein n=1 Tax=Paenibacillus sp. FSL H7-689 TaxID=1227349 RepID=UPI0003E1EB94|nr:InlB B-repeat-containing protein [Paenibacillus sp. FSL H7-689]ETT50106.1 cell wall/surface repeat-containing protein [Paenibacillus sp. FSL H7-689]